MFLGMAALFVLATVPLTGGRLARLADVRLRGRAALLATLLLQIVITDVPTGLPARLLAALHLVTYAVAAAVIWLNRRLPGLLLLGIGAGLNATVIALNGGTLPASAAALRAAGIHEPATGFSNSAALAHPRLAFLGDTMSTPAWLPLRNVISVGDLVILAGLAVFVHATCAARRSRTTSAERSDVVPV